MKLNKGIFFKLIAAVLIQVLVWLDFLWAQGDEVFDNYHNPVEDTLTARMQIDIPLFMKFFTADGLRDLVAQEKKPELSEFYEKDLCSEDPEVSLQAAVVLKGMGRAEQAIYNVFREAAVDKNLTLAQRINAAEYLTDTDKKQLGYALQIDREHFERIDSSYRELNQLGKNVNQDILISGICANIRTLNELNDSEKEDLINRFQKINWQDQELVKIAEGIDYLKEWKEVVKEILIDNYDFPPVVAEAEIQEVSLGGGG